MNKIITIGREFGSGGREIGYKLAQKLGIPFYDKEIITYATQEGALSPDILERYEESVQFGTFMHGAYNVYSLYHPVSITDRVFLAQQKVIKELAEKGPCVIVGRCANYILGDRAISVFVRADLEARIARKQALATDVAPKDMAAHVKAIDKKRKQFYEHYSEQKWGRAENHHLCIDTTHISLDTAVETVYAFVKGFNK